MASPEQVAAVLLEEEEEEYLETRHRVRNGAALTDIYFRIFSGSKPDTGQDVSYMSGSRQFDRENGVWYETKRHKNPAFWDKPQYFLIAPGPDNLAFIAVKQPRRLKASLWQKACAQIFKDATGLSWYSDGPVVDNMDEATWSRRAAGEKPEPAYEIYIDGSWKRINAMKHGES